MPLGIIAALMAILLGIALLRLQRSNQQLQDQVVELDRAKRTQQTQITYLTQLREGVLQTIPDGVLVLDPHKRILFSNPPAETLLGKNLVGQTLTAAVRNADLDDLAQEGNSEIGDDRIEFKQRTLKVIVSRLITVEQPLTMLILIDETQLHRLTRARREMVANISHELRTPITTISLLADTLQNEGTLDKKKAKQMIKDISRQTATLTQLVQEMRDLSKIESGQMPVRLTPCNLAEIIQGSFDYLNSLAEDKKQTITVDAPSDIWVLADADQIQRVIKNLVHNAIKFTPEGGKIQILTKVAADEVVISVRDNGAGIPEEMQPRIFERFFQGDFARTDGTGLGLAIARHIILSHGERLSVESQVGVGSTFSFSLTLTAPN